MKKNILKVSAAVALALAVFTGCDKDRFAKTNTDPSTIGEGNIPYLFTHAYMEFQPSDYTLWFYVADYVHAFTQVNGGSKASNYNIEGAYGGVGSQFMKVKRYELEIRDIMSRLSEEESNMYATIPAITNILGAYLAVFDTDMLGSMPYSEAGQARYGGTLTPKYDTQEELFNTLLDELDADIAILSNPGDQIALGSNDPMYGGNYDKWINFANGVKLKIAVRLLHQNKAKALQIAQQVANSGHIMTVGDSFIYNKGTNNDGGDYTYQTGNGLGPGIATANKTIIDFMKKNTDPRMLVMFTKNGFNSEVVKSFFKAESIAIANKTVKRAPDAEEVPYNMDRDIPQVPSYILENIDYHMDTMEVEVEMELKDGQEKPDTVKVEVETKVFDGWKGLGEPWVRYYGVPLGIDISEDEKWRYEENYFLSNKFRVVDGSVDRSYSPYSSMSERLLRGRCSTFNFPTPVSMDQQQITTEYQAGVPWWGMGMTAGEINLYLAELALAGASLPQSAAAYFEAGVRASAEEYRTYATKNKIPYSTEPYCWAGDEFDAPTATYGAEEIDRMLANSDYKLTGNHAEDLEKVYIQQYLHFMYQPVDQFVSARRGGVPKIGSSYLPWNTTFNPTDVPRRLYQATPTETDILKEVKEEAFREQGFTFCTGDAFQTLNTERVWYDQGAPQWGAGPNL